MCVSLVTRGLAHNVCSVSVVAAGRVQARELRPINVRHALRPTPVTRQPSHAAHVLSAVKAVTHLELPTVTTPEAVRVDTQ